MSEAETREDDNSNSKAYLFPRPSMLQTELSHDRPASATPSMKSNHSGVTTVGEKRDSLECDFRIRRQKTFRAEIQLTWLDCLRGLIFGPSKIARKAITTLKTEDDKPDENMYDDKDCPFYITVTVWPRENPTPERFETARCIFDTGCLQGNIISVELAHRLGFVEFEAASPRERHGGMSASGHMLVVQGAIHLTWYQSTSSKIFKDMRFLVSSNAVCDMLVGARSIEKHKLMSPPNLVVDTTAKPDPSRERLAAIANELKDVVADIKYQLRREPNNQALIQQRDHQQLKLNIIELEIKEYDKVKEPDDDDNGGSLDEIRRDLDKKRRDLSKLTSQHRGPTGHAEHEQSLKGGLKDNNMIESNGSASGSTRGFQPTSKGFRQRSQNHPPN